MRCLVRTITKRSKSGVTHEDASFEADEVTIGRATDQKVQLADLRVALQHARITPSAGNKGLITAQSQSGIWVNDRPVQSSRLGVGDQVTIGNNRLEVIEAPGGYDFALEVEAIQAGRETENVLAKNARMGLSETRLGKRGVSWALFLLIVSLFLVVPASGSFKEGLQDQLRQIPILSDKSWDTGPLASVHRFMGDDCSGCHQKPFVKVEDAACIDCHGQTAHHVDPEFYDMAAIRDTRCGSCHHEHNEPSTLIRQDEKLCADCHGRLTELAPESDLTNVSDFAREHPQFRVGFISHVDGKDMVERVSLDDVDALVERSGIKFPHKNHLKPGGIKTHKGVVTMSCADCHILEPGGANMVPIDMETMCLDCHRLTFDPRDREREVPHANPAAAIATLQDYYAAWALRGGYEEESAPAVVRLQRRPGQKLTVEERREALEWAEGKWREVAEKMFEYTTCASCHETRRVSDDPPAWEVMPVRIAARWMSKASFTHVKHRTMECADCHEGSAESEQSTDVSMPGIESCRECHGGERSDDRLVSTCVDCHGFHIAKDTLMARPEMAGGQ